MNFDIDVPQFTDLLAASEPQDTADPSPPGDDQVPTSSPLSPPQRDYGGHLLGGGFLLLIGIVAVVWIAFPGDREQLRRAESTIDTLKRDNTALQERIRVLEATDRTQALQIETLEQDKDVLLRSMREAHAALDGYRPAYDHLNKN